MTEDPLQRLVDVQVHTEPAVEAADAADAARAADAAGAPVVRLAAVSADPLDVGAHRRAVTSAAAGAHVVFEGVVRDHDHGRRVVELEYVGYPTAEAMLRGVAHEIATEPGVIAVAVSHRVGLLAIGDVALVAAVASAHRAQAVDACARLVDEVKARLPIWKRQVFDDGTDEWVNCP